MPPHLPSWLTERAVRPLGAGLVTGALLAGCAAGVSGGSAATSTPQAAAPTTAPPRPPAACLLDTARLGTDTGVAWTADEATAGDLRCLYDPAGGDGGAFVAVSLSADPLATVAQVCDRGTSTPVPGVDGAFVCRFERETVFAAATRGDRTVTVTASATPQGTTTARVATALANQLAGIPT